MNEVMGSRWNLTELMNRHGRKAEQSKLKTTQWKARSWHVT